MKDTAVFDITCFVITIIWCTVAAITGHTILIDYLLRILCVVAVVIIYALLLAWAKERRGRH